MSYVRAFWLTLGTVLFSFAGGLLAAAGVMLQDHFALIVFGFIMVGISTGLVMVLANSIVLRSAVVVATVLLMIGGTANADWRRLSYDRYSDGQYVYRAYYNCGCWHYDKLYPVATSDTFWDDAVRFEGKLELDTQKKDYLEKRYPFAARSGLGYATASSGYTVAQQGVAPGYSQSGSTLFAVGSYQPLPIDVNPIIARQQRANEAALAYGQQANTATNSLVSQAIDGNSAVARIEAATRATVATLQAAQAPPITTQTQWETHPEYPWVQSGTQQSNVPEKPYPPQQLANPKDDQPPPGPTEKDMGSMSLREYGHFALNACVKCHSGASPKAGLQLSETSIAAMSPEDRSDLAGRIQERMALPVSDPKHMPKGTELPQTWKQGLLALVSVN